jgi:hypothetical protein
MTPENEFEKLAKELREKGVTSFWFVKHLDLILTALESVPQWRSMEKDPPANGQRLFFSIDGKWWLGNRQIYDMLIQLTSTAAHLFPESDKAHARLLLGVNKLDRLKRHIQNVYDFDMVGGVGHIVLDDYNVEDEFIEYCREEAKKLIAITDMEPEDEDYRRWFTADDVLAAMDILLTIPEDEREQAIVDCEKRGG